MSELVNHDDRDHSSLGPSSSVGWLLCAATIKATEEFRRLNPNFDDSNAAAEAGTEAHEMGDFILQNYDLDTNSEVFEKYYKQPELKYIDDQMITIAWRYADYCMAIGVDDPGVIRATEQRLVMPEVHEQAFGTGDFSAYTPSDKKLHIVDLKYGQGVFVHIEPEDFYLDIEGLDFKVEANSQMLLYAEGQRHYLKTVHGIEPEGYVLHVYQPRMDNITTVEITPEQLRAFVEAAAYRAKLTQKDNPVYTPGHKQCFWCVAKPICKAHADYNFEIARRHFDAVDDDPDLLPGKLKDGLLTDEKVGELLDQWETIDRMGKALKAYAHGRLLDGKPVPGFKLVEGRASYTPNMAALEFVLGDEMDLYKEPKPLSKTEVQKKLGKKVFDIVAAPFYRKVTGGPTMAPASDKRAEWVPDSYSSDFDD